MKAKKKPDIDKKEYKHFYKKALKLYKEVVFIEYKESKKKGAV